MNHIYYHWSTSRFPLRSKTELPLEYCPLTALLAWLPQRLIAFKWGQRLAEVHTLDISIHSIEFTWARSPMISMIWFSCNSVCQFFALIMFKIYHLLYYTDVHTPSYMAFANTQHMCQQSMQSTWIKCLYLSAEWVDKWDVGGCRQSGDTRKHQWYLGLLGFNPSPLFKFYPENTPPIHI